MAVFLDLENIALGARDARFPRFDIQKVLERLLLKGHIVVKKAYCDFDRYKEFKRDLHEAAFELIEIPHLRMSGKNSADIRMVVDALDLCYTKGHVDTFVILSGDSDFSPLVSKLRENDKTVIGVGVKNSTSDLFINNCDTFIYYDDLVQTAPARGRARPRASVAMKLICCGVANWAAQIRSPSFSRFSSSTTTIDSPLRIAARASATASNRIGAGSWGTAPAPSRGEEERRVKGSDGRGRERPSGVGPAISLYRARYDRPFPLLRHGRQARRGDRCQWLRRAADPAPAPGPPWVLGVLPGGGAQQRQALE